MRKVKTELNIDLSLEELLKSKAPTSKKQRALNKELTKVVDTLNKSLKRLEESGYADKSKFYGDMMAALKREVPYLHTDKSGKIRYGTGHLKPTDIEGRYDLLKKLRSYRDDYSTRTIKGIKEQAKKKLATIEKNLPDLKGKINVKDVDTINEIFKMLREQGYLDHYGSGDAWSKVGDLKNKSLQEIENALNKLTDAEQATQRGRLANSKALAMLIG